MKNTLKIGLAVALVLVMSLAVAGCTSNSSSSNGADQSQQSLTLTATQVPANDSIVAYYGANVVIINATFNNNNAGTFKISSDNFYLTDSSGYSHSPVSPVATDVADSGYSSWMWVYFQVSSGTPSTLRYYDGTHDISCSVH